VKEERNGLRPAQVVAGALAAITAAFVGAQLGVYGTVIGAGLLSLGTTVGSELYLRSLERTKQAAKRTKEAALAKVALRAYARGSDATRVMPGQDATRTMPAQQGPGGTQKLPAQNGTRLMHADPEATQWLPAPNNADGPVDPDAPTVFIPRPRGEEVAPAEDQDKPRRRIRWGVVLGGTVAAFLLGMAVITGIELLTGNAISGEKGRTITNVLGVDESGNEQQQKDQPTAPDDGKSSTPSTPADSDESSPDEQEQDAPEVPQDSEEPQQPPTTEQPPASTTPTQPSTPQQEQPDEQLPQLPGQNERPGQQPAE